MSMLLMAALGYTIACVLTLGALLWEWRQFPKHLDRAIERLLGGEDDG